MRHLPLALLLLATALGLAHALSLGDLPARVPSHFGIDGQPDAWMSRAGLQWLYAGLLLGMLLMFGALGPMIRKLPVEVVNLPNRDYWLAPERREESIRAITRTLYVYGAATQVFMMVVFWESAQASRSGGALSDRVWIHLGIFGIATLAWVISLFRRFPAP